MCTNVTSCFMHPLEPETGEHSQRLGAVINITSLIFFSDLVFFCKFGTTFRDLEFMDAPRFPLDLGHLSILSSLS